MSFRAYKTKNIVSLRQQCDAVPCDGAEIPFDSKVAAVF